MKVNINSNVTIKLRKPGRVILREQHQKFTPQLDYEEPLPDGIMEMPLWRVMQTFGPHITMGFDPPFDPDIDISLKDKEPLRSAARTTPFEGENAGSSPAEATKKLRITRVQKGLFFCVLVSVFVMTWISNSTIMLNVPVWIVIDALAAQVIILGAMTPTQER